ncbi:unnamed protein product [Blepharisma stoltei]|uniref:Sugar transporter SWEET n=1 Tax=Blepharisma stoltei TaxID=1481888 RepID=A0AAU9JGA7_9CILI|nr:unnamed protein product [Blepharisma stoltei]
MEAFLGTIGTILGFGCTLMPIYTFYEAEKTKNLEKFSHLGMMVCNVNTIVWVVYAYLGNEMTILINTIVCGGLNFVYLLWYHKIKGDILEFVSKFLVTALIFVGSFIGLCSFNVIGQVATMVSLIGCFPPLEQIGLALKEKSHRYFDIVCIIPGFLCVNIWLWYGILTSNFHIIIPNIITFVIATMQILLYMWAKGYFESYILDELSKDYWKLSSIKKVNTL